MLMWECIFARKYLRIFYASGVKMRFVITWLPFKKKRYPLPIVPNTRELMPLIVIKFHHKICLIVMVQFTYVIYEYKYEKQ